MGGGGYPTYHIIGGAGFGALTWDPTRGVLWACNGHETNVGTIDLTTSKFTPVFMAQGCTDALAYDPSDDTLWAGRDGGHSVATVEHYTTQGTLLSSANVGGLVNDRAGLAIAGSRIYMASPHSGYPKHIWQTTRSFSSANVIMTWTGGAKAEDLECDGTTFSSPVMWVQWNHQNMLKAYSIGGTCGPPAGAELTTTQTASPSRVTADSALTITTKITDLGPVDAPNATATVTLPPTAVITAANPSQGSCTSQPPISCSLGTILVGASATITETLTPLAPGAATATASATSNATISPASDVAAFTVTAQPGTIYTSVSDTGLAPTTTPAALGGTVQWNFLGPGLHSVRDNSGLGTFDTGPIMPVSYSTTLFTASGNFPLTDALSTRTGVVSVPVSVPATAGISSPFTVLWASNPLAVGLVEDIQIKRPGQTVWVTFKTSQTAQSVAFTPDVGAEPTSSGRDSETRHPARAPRIALPRASG